MKVENAINYLVLDILKNILSMAEKPDELGKYITNQVRELIGCRMVILFSHDEKDHNPEALHRLVGICPARKITDINLKIWNDIAEASHSFHSTTLFEHRKSGIRIEQLLQQLNSGDHSIIVPLEYARKRVGILAIFDIYEIQNINSIIESLDSLSGVLAIELRNAGLMQNLENLVAARTIELSESEKRFRTIIEQANDAMFIAEQTGEILDVNNQACKSMQYSREEMLRMNISDFNPILTDKKKLIDLYRQIELTGGLTFESVHRRKDGSTFPVEINANVIQIENKSVAIGFARDITDRKIAEEKTWQIARHYQALIDKAPDGIVLISEEGNFKFVSPSARKMFGYSIDEEIAGSPAPFTHPEDLPAVLNLLQNLLGNPSLVSTLQYRFVDKTGSWRWVESTFSNMLDDPSVEAIVINFRDITDRKNAEEQINKLNEELERKVIERTDELEQRSQELLNNEAALLNLVEDLNLKSEELLRNKAQLEVANKELEAFSYSVSHDLRAPLRAINGFVSILLEDYEKVLDTEGKRICTIIQSNASKMGQLIDDLLSFSRLIRSEMHLLPIDMENLVKSVISEFEISHSLSNIDLVIHQLHPATGDGNLIRQVWINLISNALKYTSKNTDVNITIGSAIENNEIVYFVKDNGVGFNMDYAHKLFGVFQRLHSINEFDGTGVGLAIVKRIVNRHNGRVWAESSPGKGASFYFTLPNNLM